MGGDIERDGAEGSEVTAVRVLKICQLKQLVSSICQLNLRISNSEFSRLTQLKLVSIIFEEPVVLIYKI